MAPLWLVEPGAAGDMGVVELVLDVEPVELVAELVAGVVVAVVLAALASAAPPPASAPVTASAANMRLNRDFM